MRTPSRRSDQGSRRAPLILFTVLALVLSLLGGSAGAQPPEAPSIDPIEPDAGDILISQTDGVLWVYDADTGDLTDHPLPFGGIWDIQWDNGNSILIANSGAGRIWHLDLASGEFQLVAEGEPLGFPIGLALDPTDEDALWVADSNAGILRLDRSSGDTQVVVPYFGGAPDGIVVDDDGSVYFTEGSGIVYRVNTAAPGSYEVIADVGPYSLNGLVFDEAGSLLATAIWPSAVAEIDVATGTSTVYDYSVQMRSSEDTAVDTDGNWWVIDSGFVDEFGDDAGLYRVDIPGMDIVELHRGAPLGDTVDLLIVPPRGIEVALDIKPGSDPNSINCKNEKSNIAVAVLTTDDFDAMSVDHTTVTFEGASETHVDKKTGEPRRHEDDVDGDGDIDLVFHFRLGDTSLTCYSTMGALVGETYDGIPIEGSDSVRMVGGGAACGSAPDSAGVSCQDIRDRCPGTPSGERWIAPDGTTSILAYCDMDEEGNGWTLIYNRNNAYFSPDHMYHELPAQGPDFFSNSTSWFIPNDATRWRWEVSVDSGASYRTLETSIPPEARATTHATVENAPIGTVYENTTGASGPFYFQTIDFSDRCLYGCGSDMASWWGIVDVNQGAGDQPNPGLGGHTDSCSLDSMLLSGDNYTWGDGDLELYLSDWKDIGGEGIGGTNCVPDSPTTQYRYRFWAR